jgi:hypothetical protein
LSKLGKLHFDLSKITEIFVRHKETLQRELKRHLNPLEGSLFDSMAWEKDSLMKNSLIAANPGHFNRYQLSKALT